MNGSLVSVRSNTGVDPGVLGAVAGGSVVGVYRIVVQSHVSNHLAEAREQILQLVSYFMGRIVTDSLANRLQQGIRHPAIGHVQGVLSLRHVVRVIDTANGSVVSRRLCTGVELQVTGDIDGV